MKRVLWISRHEMSETQFKDLERIMGEEVELLCWKDTVRMAEELLPAMKQVDAIAAVLPLQMLAQVKKLAEDKPVLQAISERILSDSERLLEDGRKEQDVLFVHRHWEQILKLDILTKVL